MIEKKSKLVSICIPAYNASATIFETLESICKQTYQEIEIVVVDNASTDDTLDIVNSVCDERLRVYRNDSNIGMIGNWNKCLDYAKGDYIQIVCADDILDPSCIEKKVRFMEREDDIVLVFGATVIINEQGKKLMERRDYKKDRILDGVRLAKKSFYFKNLYGEPSNVLFRRELLQKTEKFAQNLYYTTDWEMWIRMSCQGKVGYLSEALVKYRVFSSNATSKTNFRSVLKEDKIMIRNIRSYGFFKMNCCDEFLHHFFYILRMLARNFYMYLVCR